MAGIGAGQNYIGGITGYNNGGISDSFAKVDVTATAGNYHGGLVGNNSSAIVNCYWKGNLTSSGGLVGGISGSSWSNSIMRSFAFGGVSGSSLDHAVSLTSGDGGLLTDVHFDSNSICTNPIGNCTNYGTGIDTALNPQYFFDPSNPPLSLWDFDTIWQEVPGDLPVLRRP